MENYESPLDLCERVGGGKTGSVVWHAQAANPEVPLLPHSVIRYESGKPLSHDVQDVTELLQGFQGKLYVRGSRRGDHQNQIGVLPSRVYSLNGEDEIEPTLMSYLEDIQSLAMDSVVRNYAKRFDGISDYDGLHSVAIQPWIRSNNRDLAMNMVEHPNNSAYFVLSAKHGVASMQTMYNFEGTHECVHIRKPISYRHFFGFIGNTELQQLARIKLAAKANEFVGGRTSQLEFVMLDENAREVIDRNKHHFQFQGHITDDPFAVVQERWFMPYASNQEFPSLFQFGDKPVGYDQLPVLNFSELEQEQQQGFVANLPLKSLGLSDLHYIDPTSIENMQGVRIDFDNGDSLYRDSEAGTLNHEGYRWYMKVPFVEIVDYEQDQGLIQTLRNEKIPFKERRF